MAKGYIYILTNPSFPQYVKIGYASDVQRRLGELNRSESLPFAFRVFATYETTSDLSDKEVHKIIDALNPDLRSIEEFDGKKRIREFYAMDPEDAYSILESIAKISGTEKCLKRWKETKQEAKDKEIAEVVRSHAKPVDFLRIGIPVGAELELWHKGECKATCTVVDNRHVKFNDEITSLTGVAREITGIKNVPGPDYFKYNGEWINDIRRKYGELKW